MEDWWGTPAERGDTLRASRPKGRQEDRLEGDQQCAGARRAEPWTDDRDYLFAAMTLGQCRGRAAAAARLRHEPGRDLSHPGSAADASLRGVLSLARRTGGTMAAGARTRSFTSASTARSNGCRERGRPVERVFSRHPARRSAADLSVHRQRSGRGQSGQAARATPSIVDHLMPPMTNADTYGPLASLNDLVNEYYSVEKLDPSKLPIVQQQIWELIQKAQLQADLDLRAHAHARPRRSYPRLGRRADAGRRAGVADRDERQRGRASDRRHRRLSVRARHGSDPRRPARARRGCRRCPTRCAR